MSDLALVRVHKMYKIISTDAGIKIKETLYIMLHGGIKLLLLLEVNDKRIYRIYYCIKSNMRQIGILPLRYFWVFVICDILNKIRY